MIYLSSIHAINKIINANGNRSVFIHQQEAVITEPAVAFRVGNDPFLTLRIGEMELQKFITLYRYMKYTFFYSLIGKID